MPMQNRKDHGRELARRQDRRLASRPSRSRSRSHPVILALLLCALFGLARRDAVAQETPESRAFRAAATAFQDGIYDLAERRFSQFVSTYPQSPLLGEAVLLYAQAAIKQTNLTAAISALNTHVGKAGLLADQYHSLLAFAYFQNGNFAAAADAYAFITRQFTNSSLRLDASHGEALARFKLRDFSRVISLLRDPGGAFQRSALTRPESRLAISGRLILAEALLEQREHRAAEETVKLLDRLELPPDLAWDRQYLLCRILVGNQRLNEALAQTTNLIAIANSRSLRADSVAIQAGVLQQLDRVDEALQAYTNNLADIVPADRRRMAMLGIVELKLAQGDLLNAIERLDTFLSRHPEDASSDVALLASGELQLKLYLSGPGASAITNSAAILGEPTNRLQAALAQFEKLQSIHTNSPLRGKALLNKGWCLWLDNKVNESARAFSDAAGLLPFSEELAIVKFKLADIQFAQGDYTNALKQYKAFTNDFAALPRVRESLFDHALYQIVSACTKMNDEPGASATLKELLEAFPGSAFGGRGLWLVGQELIQGKRPAHARDIFEEYLRRFKSGPMLPQIELAIARTYFHEGEWNLALGRYEDWLSRHPTNELGPRAEFNRAWATDKAGDATNAMRLFKNIVADFPTNELAARAQFWMADEYYRRGDHTNALAHYQKIFENTNWPITKLTYQARMMAGRSAVAAQLWQSAAGDKGHFTEMANDTTCPNENCPEELVAEALFAFGDALPYLDANPARPLENFAEARKAFRRIYQFYPGSLLVPLAWGRYGDCSLQLASQDPKEYGEATNAYRIAMNTAGDISTRSRAEFALARALEEQSRDPALGKNPDLLKDAFEHYYNVATEANCRVGEKADPLWLEKAGLAAGRIAEEQGHWATALSIYQRLLPVLAPARTRLEDRIARAQKSLSKD